MTTSGVKPVNSPGAVLKRCRQFHKITLEEAAKNTRIGITYLESLEEDRISGFTNITYLKGFLRIYADYLGLNPDDMTRMYEKLYGAKDGKINDEEKSANTARPPRRFIYLKRLILPAFLLFMIIFTATFLKHQPASTIRPLLSVATAPVTLPPTPMLMNQTSAKIGGVPKEIGEPKGGVTGIADGLSQTKTADFYKGFILKIKVTRNGNLNAVVDDSPVQAYELTVGDVIEWKALKSVSLDLSDAGGIAAELNGKPLKQLGPQGIPAYVVLDSNGIKP